MCIKKVEAWEYAGKTYTREIDAIIAAIAKRIGNNEAIARNVADSATDLIPLLQRAKALLAPKSQDATAPETIEKHPPMPYALRTGLLGRLQRWAQTDEGKDKAKTFIEAGGYKDLADLNSRASDADVLSMDDELDNLGVA